MMHSNTKLNQYSISFTENLTAFALRLLVIGKHQKYIVPIFLDIMTEF